VENWREKESSTKGVNDRQEEGQWNVKLINVAYKRTLEMYKIKDLKIYHQKHYKSWFMDEIFYNQPTEKILTTPEHHITNKVNKKKP